MGHPESLKSERKGEKERAEVMLCTLDLSSPSHRGILTWFPFRHVAKHPRLSHDFHHDTLCECAVFLGQIFHFSSLQGQPAQWKTKFCYMRGTRTLQTVAAFLEILHLRPLLPSFWLHSSTSQGLEKTSSCRPLRLGSLASQAAGLSSRSPPGQAPTGHA